MAKNELLDMNDVKRRMDGEHRMRGDEGRDGHEVAARVHAHLIEVRTDDDLRIGAQQQRVAVGRGARCRLVADVAVAACPVVDDHRLAQAL